LKTRLSIFARQIIRRRPMRIFYPIFFFTLFFLCSRSFAQTPLPHIEVKNYDGKVIVSWVNNYKRPAKVINIQRSDDSLRDFTTIGSVLNPENIDNGYLDSKAPKGKVFYRVFIAFPGGSYAFSRVKRPVTVTRDSMLTSGDSIAMLYNRMPIPKPARHIYIGRENNIMISLPGSLAANYSVRFYDENEKMVFEIGRLTEPELILDKANFLHGGWFFYELFDRSKLVEKDKFFLPKDEKGRPVMQAEKGKRNKP